MASISEPAPPARRSPFARLALAPDGRLHGPRLIGGAVLGVVAIALTTFVGLLLAGAGSPQALGIWVLAGFLLVKVPLLGVLWWILMRQPEAAEGSRTGGWSRSECHEILAYLERQADAARAQPDAAARLTYFAREARYVADHANDADRPAAVAAAARLESLAREAVAGARRERSSP